MRRLLCFPSSPLSLALFTILLSFFLPSAQRTLRTHRKRRPGHTETDTKHTETRGWASGRPVFGSLAFTVVQIHFLFSPSPFHLSPFGILSSRAVDSPLIARSSRVNWSVNYCHPNPETWTGPSYSAHEASGPKRENESSKWCECEA